jgi:hypothetical protein
MKDALKEAIREWLDEKYSEFGKLSMHTIAAAALAALAYYLVSHGHFDLAAR